MSSQAIIQDIDFNISNTAYLPNIRGVMYSGVGSPNNVVMGANIGAIYVDTAAAQLWFCITASSTSNYSWIPYGSTLTSNIPISSDVQEGQLVGIFGAGSWSLSGNLNTSRISFSGCGSQNAALITGGSDNAGASSIISSTEVFNGSTWSLSGNMNFSRDFTAGLGSTNAAIIAGGYNDQVHVLSSTELFNGSTWTSSANMNVSRLEFSGFGSQNAGVVNSGFNGAFKASLTSETFNGSTWVFSGNINTTRFFPIDSGTLNSGLAVGGQSTAALSLKTSELFNGTVWSFSGNLNISRSAAAGSGSQNSTLVSAGSLNGAALTSSETFNGSTWSFSNNLNISRIQLVGQGAPNAGLVSGGYSDGLQTPFNTSELHNQSIYRVLTYKDYPAASNIGIAINTTNTTLTASLIKGVFPSNIVSPYYNQTSTIPYVVNNNQFFGLSKFNNDTYATVAASITNGQVVSLSVTNTGQIQLNLSTNNSLTNIFCYGMLLNITNTGTGIASGNYPIVGGSSYTGPIIRNASATVTGGEALLIKPMHGKLMYGFQSNISSTTLNGLNALNVTITNNGNMGLTALTQMIKIRDVIQIPYGTTVSTGSLSNYGSYQIQLLSTTGSVLTATVYQIRPLTLAENNVSNVSIMSQIVHNPICLDDSDVLLGLNSRMNLVGNPGYDDSAAGAV